MQETQETRVWSLSWEDLLEEEMATHPSILAGKFHGQRSLAGLSPWGHKESDTTKCARTHILGTTFLSPDPNQAMWNGNRLRKLGLDPSPSWPILGAHGEEMSWLLPPPALGLPIGAHIGHSKMGFGKPVLRITSQATEHVHREDARTVQWKFLEQRESPVP